MLVRTIANPAHSAPTNFVVRRLDADWLDCGRLFVDRRPVQRPGHQLLDQCRVKVQAVVPGSIVTSPLRLRGIKVVPWLSVYASHKRSDKLLPVGLDRRPCCRLRRRRGSRSAVSRKNSRMHTSRRNLNAFIPMSEFSFLSLCVAAGLAVVWSIIFIGKITTQKKIAWGDVKTWIRNVVDSLFGMG